MTPRVHWSLVIFAILVGWVAISLFVLPRVAGRSARTPSKCGHALRHHAEATLADVCMVEGCACKSFRRDGAEA